MNTVATERYVDIQQIAEVLGSTRSRVDRYSAVNV